MSSLFRLRFIMPISFSKFWMILGIANVSRHESFFLQARHLNRVRTASNAPDQGVKEIRANFKETRDTVIHKSEEPTLSASEKFFLI
jgi:hypothetical protein